MHCGPASCSSCSMLVLPGLLLLAFCADARDWDPAHRSLWAANAGAVRVPAAGAAGAAGAARAQSKRHAAPSRQWVPGSKVPLYHYPTDTRPPQDDALQYMEGADTEMSVRRTLPRASPRASPHADEPPRQQQQQRGGAGRRRTAGERRLRHQRQRGHPAQQPNSNVTAVLRTVQRGSAVVPLPLPTPEPGAPALTIPVHPDPSKTQRTLVSFAQPPRGAPPAAANLMERPSSLMDAGVPDCPADKTVLAPRGQDYVIMERITARDGTPLDVIAGPQAGDPVSEGPHPVVGRLVPGAIPGAVPGVPGAQGRQSRLCRLAYTVMVRRCGAPPALTTVPAGRDGPRSPRCTAGTAWGSRCHYRCPRRDLQLRGPSWTQCGDDLRWDGPAPVCTERPGWSSAVVTQPPPPPRRSCPVPPLPEHGQLSCRALEPGQPGQLGQPGQPAEEDNDAQRLAEGSECTVSCRPPHRLQHLVNQTTAVMRCRAGRWNATSWLCVRGEVLDADLEGDIAVLSDGAPAALVDDWDRRENSVTDPCSPNPCHSGGTCLRGPPTYRALCQCRPGTEGERCERVLCRATCQHGGRCILVRGRPSCFCREGYAGSRCQAPVKQVRYPAPTTPSAGTQTLNGSTTFSSLLK